MINLSGYKITEMIYTGKYSTVYRGIRKEDSLPVLIKFLNQEYPSDQCLSFFKREYEITKKASGEDSLLVYDLVTHNNTLGIVMEDIGGIPLSQAIESMQLSLPEKLSIAIKIADCLSVIHKKNIIHKNINPSNIIWNKETNRVEIIDYAIAVELKREMAHKMNLHFFEGSAKYCSPEQTGRINRPVDSRSDLYSLGITLYELFTSERPFTGKDDSELIYSQIAKKPEPPHTIKKNIPEMVSMILLKLLEKDADDRYQMASGVKKDLEQCLDNVLYNNEVIPFEIGKFDISDQLKISGKLYGREEALEVLKIRFNDVADGKSALMMIQGNAGIGKTALIMEFSKTVSLRKGIFINGKFNPETQYIPLQGVLEALHKLMNWLLSLPEDQLAFWKKNILSTVPQNAAILTEHLPELKKIIGEQPPIIELNPLEAHNRFLFIFYDFISLFGSPNAPLVFFLDDLQWCDSTTLALIKYMIDKSTSSNILFIGAYRHNDLTSDHPLLVTLNAFNNRLKNIQTVTLHPLTITDIDELVADTFRRAPDEDTLSVANMIYRKTGGTPYFIHELLESLNHHGFFELIGNKWVCDINRFKNVNVSDNVIDLLTNKINDFSPSTNELLKIASCIGNQFDLKLLAKISNKKEAEVGAILWPVIKNDIIFPLNPNYKLMHLEDSNSSIEILFSFQDIRIQQLIYSQIPEEEKQSIHLKIGQELAFSIQGHEDPDHLFNKVNHMNKGRFLIKEFSERVALRDLNTEAAHKAIKATAFSMAVTYYSVAESLLSENEWSENPKAWNLALFSLGESLFLSGDFEKAKDICEKMRPISDTPLLKAKTYNLKARILEFQGFIPENIEEIRKGLNVLGFTFPEDDQEIERRIGEGVVSLQKILFSGDDSIEKLASLPIMEDEEKIQTMELLYNVVAPALQYRPSLFILSTLMMFDLTQKYGATSYSCKCLVDIAITHSPTFGDFSIGYRLGKTAFLLLKRLNAESMKPAVYFSFTFASYRNKHFKEALEYFDLAYASGLQTGDIQHAAYARAHKMHLYMQVGKKLSECKEENEDAIRFLNETKAGMPLLLSSVIQYMIKKYTSENVFDEDDDIVSRIQQAKNMAFLWRFYQYNSMYFYIHNELDKAKKWCELSNSFLFASLSDFPGPEHSMLKGLLIIKFFDSLSEEEKPEKMKELTELLNSLKKAAVLCPANFVHKYYFLSAETAILKNDSQEEVLNWFNKAIESLQNDDFMHIKALIYESIASYWYHEENEMIAKAYYREAHFLFKKWGAVKKVALMEAKFPFLKSAFSKALAFSSKIHSVKNNEIDMASIMKAMQAISGEIRLEKLLRSMMSLILENAGARQGVLLLVNGEDKELYIEAEKKSFNDEIEVMQSLPYRKSTNICPEIIQFVSRSLENMVLGNAWKESVFKNTSHIQEAQIKSILSIPILYQNKLIGIIYLEHDLAEDVFTEERIQTVKILSSQAAISIVNARLYESLEKKVQERTAQLNQANEKLKLLSLQDPLTTLHNRRYIFEFVSDFSVNFITRKLQLQKKHEMRDLSINRKVIGVFMIDIDFFKTVNDTYGHLTGDKVLVTLSRLLKEQIRADDFVARWGGEEFIIILNTTNPEYLDIFANKILNIIREKPIVINEKISFNITCSIGYSMMPIHELSPDLLNLEQTINISDVAMYLAKENGRNRAVKISVNQKKKMTPECIDYLKKLNKTDPINKEFIEVNL